MKITQNDLDKYMAIGILEDKRLFDSSGNINSHKFRCSNCPAEKLCDKKHDEGKRPTCVETLMEFIEQH